MPIFVLEALLAVVKLSRTLYLYKKQKMGHGVSGAAVLALLGYTGAKPWQLSWSLAPCCEVLQLRYTDR